MSTSLPALNEGSVSSGSLSLGSFNLDSLTLEPLPADTRQQLLRFSLGQDSVLLPLEQITEIVQVNVMEILPVPETPSCAWGVCNWQGELLWLVDLDALVGCPPLLQQQFQQEPMSLIVLVVQFDNQVLGLGVQQVGEIELHELQKLQPPTPGLFPPKLQPFVLGALPECRGAVLNVTAIVQCPLWQTYPG
jgi:positive phototaxis protein PixI